MGELIRVLQMVTQMNRAGLESRLMDIYRNIDRSHVQFDFYTFREQQGDYDNEIRKLGGMVYYEKPLTLACAMDIPSRLRNFFISHPQYKIVHCHMNQWCGLVLKGAKQAGVQVRIAHSRTALRKISIKNIIKNVIKLSVNKYATHRFAVSYKAGEWLYGTSVMKKGYALVLPNAIDVSKFIYKQEGRAIKRHELGISEETVLIHIGNIRPPKNHEFLLSVFYEFLKERSDSILLIVGADGRAGFIQKLAADMGIYNQVRFLGSRTDVPELLWAADVFVFPSLYEGFPGSVLEAQAAGLPCVVSDSITNEVCLTERIRQMSIRANAGAWAKQILNYINTPREAEHKTVIQKGYDIAGLSAEIQEFYTVKNKNYK